MKDREGSEVERLAHGICDALKFVEDKTAFAILNGLLKGTDHEGHRDWHEEHGQWRSIGPVEEA